MQSVSFDCGGHAFLFAERERESAMKKLLTVVASAALALCLAGCADDTSNKVSSQAPSEDKSSSQSSAKQRSQIESLSDVSNAINESLALIPNCDISVYEDKNSCLIYDGQDEIGFIEFYHDDDSFAVYSPAIDEENYDSIKVTTNVMTATIMACNASHDVEAAEEVLMDLVTNDETRDGGVNYTVGTRYDYNVLIVEL